MDIASAVLFFFQGPNQIVILDFSGGDVQLDLPPLPPLPGITYDSGGDE